MNNPRIVTQSYRFDPSLCSVSALIDVYNMTRKEHLDYEIFVARDATEDIHVWYSFFILLVFIVVIFVTFNIFVLYHTWIVRYNIL